MSGLECCFTVGWRDSEARNCEKKFRATLLQDMRDNQHRFADWQRWQLQQQLQQQPAMQPQPLEDHQLAANAPLQQHEQDATCTALALVSEPTGNLTHGLSIKST